MHATRVLLCTWTACEVMCTVPAKSLRTNSHVVAVKAGAGTVAVIRAHDGRNSVLHRS